MAPTNARFHSPSGRGSKEGGRRKGKKASQGGGDYSEHTFRLTTSSLISFVGWFFLPGVDSFGGVTFCWCILLQTGGRVCFQVHFRNRDYVECVCVCVSDGQAYSWKDKALTSEHLSLFHDPATQTGERGKSHHTSLCGEISPRHISVTCEAVTCLLTRRQFDPGLPPVLANSRHNNCFRQSALPAFLRRVLKLVSKRAVYVSCKCVSCTPRVCVSSSQSSGLRRPRQVFCG